MKIYVIWSCEKNAGECQHPALVRRATLVCDWSELDREPRERGMGSLGKGEVRPSGLQLPPGTVLNYTQPLPRRGLLGIVLPLTSVLTHG